MFAASYSRNSRPATLKLNDLRRLKCQAETKRPQRARSSLNDKGTAVFRHSATRKTRYRFLASATSSLTFTKRVNYLPSDRTHAPSVCDNPKPTAQCSYSDNASSMPQHILRRSRNCNKRAHPPSIHDFTLPATPRIFSSRSARLVNTARLSLHATE